jgi:hypothetical protein
VGRVNRRIVVQAGVGIKARPIQKITKAKRAGGMAQVAECLPSKYKALSSYLQYCSPTPNVQVTMSMWEEDQHCLPPGNCKWKQKWGAVTHWLQWPYTKYWEDTEQQQHSLLVEMKHHYDSPAFSHKAKDGHTRSSSHWTPGIYPIGFKSCEHTKICMWTTA